MVIDNVSANSNLRILQEYGSHGSSFVALHCDIQSIHGCERVLRESRSGKEQNGGTVIRRFVAGPRIIQNSGDQKVLCSGVSSADGYGKR